MLVEIKQALDVQEAEVIALWNSCDLIVSHNNPIADYRFAIGKPNSDILLALASGKIVGSVMVGHDGHRGWLYYVAVSPEYRLRGIGRALVRDAEEWFSARGIAKAQLMIRDTDTNVAAFYEAIGYKAIPRTVMEKWLKRAD